MSAANNSDIQTLRVDLVGSLLRPRAVKDAFAGYGTGQVSEAELKRVQDEAIRAVVAKQVAHDLPIVVDGESDTAETRATPYLSLGAGLEAGLVFF